MPARRAPPPRHQRENASEIRRRDAGSRPGTAFVILGPHDGFTHRHPALSPRSCGSDDRPGPRYTLVSDRRGVQLDTSTTRRIADASRPRPTSKTSRCPCTSTCRSARSGCSYCGCMVIITQKREVAARYLDYLEREIEMLAAALGRRRRVVQHHWGGGTPTYLTLEQIARLDGAVRRHFEFDAGRRARDRDRSRGSPRASSSSCCGASGSTASPWACRTSRRTSRRPSTAASRRR